MNRHSAKTTPNPTSLGEEQARIWLPGKKPNQIAIKKEMASFGPYIGGCGPHADFIPQGACSDQNTPKENEAIRKGEKPSNIKKRKVKSESFAEFLANRESEQRGKNG